MSQRSQQNHSPKTKPKQTQTESVCLFLRNTKNILSLTRDVTGLISQIASNISKTAYYGLKILFVLLCFYSSWFLITNQKIPELVFKLARLISSLIRLLPIIGG